MAFLALGVAAWIDREPSMPFGVGSDVGSVLADWRRAGLSCGEPSVGMPGPMLDWGCTGELEGVPAHAALEADAHGVFGIHAAVPAGTSGETTARAFVRLLRATSLVRAAQPEMEAWLISTGAADGVMPIAPTTGIRRAVVYRDTGPPTLFVVPLGSSMLLAE